MSLDDPTSAAAAVVEAGARLAARGLAHGATGNVSVRLRDGSILVTPTGARLAGLDSARLSRLDSRGEHAAGDRPSKEWPLHVATYHARADATAIVHLHSRHAVAVSCLAGLDPLDVLPTYTAYQAMRVGRLRLVGFHRPGDPSLGDAVGAAARGARAILLANHGLVAAGVTVDAALETAEEIEESCALHLLLAGRSVSAVPAPDVAALRSGGAVSPSSGDRPRPR